MALEETAGFTVLVHLPEPRVDYHETVGGKEVMQWTPTHKEKLVAGRQGNSFLSVKGKWSCGDGLRRYGTEAKTALGFHRYTCVLVHSHFVRTCVLACVFL